MKRLIAVICLIVVLISGCKMSREDICEKAGGKWKQMPNACVDSCESQRDGMMCAQVLTEGCDCGQEMCWNGTGCEMLETEETEQQMTEDIEIHKINFTKQETIDPLTMQIKRNDKVRFYNNQEEFLNKIAIYRQKVDIVEPEDVIVESPNVDPEDYWEYQFNETGNFTIRSLYSDTRGLIVVE
ncbi:hypothetical protein GF361_02905 [Candidatus Woesearchaeota archaeon]|nr:hypothetical protein [Candidatus Woesearchaeota archaeon]